MYCILVACNSMTNPSTRISLRFIRCWFMHMVARFIVMSNKRCNTTLRTSGLPVGISANPHVGILAILYCNCQGIISNNLLLISNPNPNPNLCAPILTLITLILTPLTVYIAASFACDRDFRIFRKIGCPQSRVSKLLKNRLPSVSSVKTANSAKVARNRGMPILNDKLQF